MITPAEAERIRENARRKLHASWVARGRPTVARCEACGELAPVVERPTAPESHRRTLGVHRPGGSRCPGSGEPAGPRVVRPWEEP